MKKVIAVIILLLFVSCSSQYIVRYEYTLEDVSPSDNATFDNTLYGRYKYLYNDKDMELYFDIAPYEIGLFIKNIDHDTLRIIWDKAYLETEFNGNEKFKLTHTNREQEYISLKDTTKDNYQKLKVIKRLQETDKSYHTKPTIILPGDSFVDRIHNSEKKDFYPYVISKNESFESITERLKNKNIILHLPIRVNNNLKNLIFTIKVEDIYKIQQD